MKCCAIAGLLALAAFPTVRAADSARRLSRYEYTCSVRDLLGVDLRASKDLPGDADTMAVTPALLGKYLDAARKIARMAVEAVPPPATPQLTRYSNASSLSDITWEHGFDWDGDYDFHIGIAGRRDPITLFLSVDAGEPRRLEVSGDFEGRRYADTRLNLAAGTHRLRVYTVRDGEVSNPLYPEFIEARGPYGPVFPALPPGYGLVYTCGHAPGRHTSACVRTNLRDLARRAWRRPVTAAEIDRLMKVVTADRDLEHQMETGIEAILVSPSFLFRSEDLPGSQFDLASRLSYFLWSSLPDATLFQTAERGRLTDPAVLTAQARRMLADPKANALAENFAAQWLQFGNLDSVHRDHKRFPEFNVALRDAMRKETELFVESVIRENRGVLDFLNAKYTFLNEPLAKLYGIAGVTGEEFRKVDLTGTPRAGIVTQASVLTVTSYATRTSPVLRGKWILQNILNDPPPPPPANVAALRDPKDEPALTLRQQLEEHRANAACAGCHSRMDPLGFGLENFDAIGRWRMRDESLPVDPAGTLPDGSSFSSPGELAAILGKRPEVFAGGLTEKLLAFALGRELNAADRATAAQVVQSAASGGYRFSDLIVGIVGSEAFRAQREPHE